MAEVILDNLSRCKLSVLLSCLLSCQIACFLIGGLIAPEPYGGSFVSGNICIDDGSKSLLYSRGKGHCNIVDNLEDEIIKREEIGAEEIVFVFQIPRKILDYSRWHQNLIGTLIPHITYSYLFPFKNINSTMTLDVRLGYRNIGDRDDDWKLMASSLEERTLDCTCPNGDDEHSYFCSLFQLFVLGSVHHSFYLINIRLPIKNDLNAKIGFVTDFSLLVAHQNVDFTKMWLSLKTVFFLIIIAVLTWYWKRIQQMTRSPVLFEKMLFAVGLALTLFNLPLEYLSLWFDMPYMLSLNDIRRNIFYATLLSFWLIFVGEHIKDDVECRFFQYALILSPVVFGCFSFSVFHVYEWEGRVRNPFFNIWETSFGTNLANDLIILAKTSGSIYFLYLILMICRVFRIISHKKRIVYRFKILMLTTLLCAALTVVFSIKFQVYNDRRTGDDDVLSEYKSALFCGVHGMCNIYVFALIVLYAPSHIRWPVDTIPNRWIFV